MVAPLHVGAVLLLGRSLEEPRAIGDSGLRRTRGPPCSFSGSWRWFRTCSGTEREAAMRYDALPKGAGGFLPACIRTSGAREDPGQAGRRGVRAQSRRGSPGLSGSCSRRLSSGLMKAVFP